MSTLTQRKNAAKPEEPPVEDDVEPQEPRVGPPEPWYAGRMVRAILVLLGIFAVVHVVLWKVVYDYMMDTDHGRLHDTVQLAWTKFEDIRNALD